MADPQQKESDRTGSTKPKGAKAFAALPPDPSVTDVFKLFPRECLPLFELHDRILRQPSPEAKAFTVGDREIVAAFVSAQNECRFCEGAHTAIAHQFGVEETVLATLLGKEGGGSRENNENSHLTLTDPIVTAVTKCGLRVAGLSSKKTIQLFTYLRTLTVSPGDARSLYRQRNALAVPDSSDPNEDEGDDGNLPSTSVAAASSELKNNHVVSDAVLHDAVMICSLFSFMNRVVEGHGVVFSDDNLKATKERHRREEEAAEQEKSLEEEKIKADHHEDPQTETAVDPSSTPTASSDRGDEKDMKKKHEDAKKGDSEYHTYVNYGKTIGVIDTAYVPLSLIDGKN